MFALFSIEIENNMLSFDMKFIRCNREMCRNGDASPDHSAFLEEMVISRHAVVIHVQLSCYRILVIEISWEKMIF